MVRVNETLSASEIKSLARVVSFLVDAGCNVDRCASAWSADVDRVWRLRKTNELARRVDAALAARFRAEAYEDAGELDACVRVAQALAVVDVIAAAIAAQEGK